MPDIWTHILCGYDTISTLEDCKRKEIIEKRIKVFNLGCQGPDIFLYNDFWPWIKEKRGVKYGRLLHLKKTGDFFIEGLNFLKNKVKNKEEFNILFSYLAGFMCHFGLDRNAHPYIHYYAGVFDKSKPKTIKYSGYHKKLELIIDAIILKEKRNIDAYQYPVYKEIDIGEELPKVINDFFVYILNKLYKPKINLDFIGDSYNDIKRVMKIIHDPFGYKKVLLNFIDLFVNDQIRYSGLTYPRRIDDIIDYMNRKHNIWNHPCNKEEVYNHSFDDIYDNAVKENKIMIKGAISYLDDKIDIKQLQTYFPSVSYSTGKSTSKECELIYFNPIFD